MRERDRIAGKASRTELIWETEKRLETRAIIRLYGVKLLGPGVLELIILLSGVKLPGPV